MIGNRQTIPQYQSDFYRNSYYKILRIVLAALILNICLILGIIYFIVFTEPRNYFASTTTGEIIPLKPIMQGHG